MGIKGHHANSRPPWPASLVATCHPTFHLMTEISRRVRADCLHELIPCPKVLASSSVTKFFCLSFESIPHSTLYYVPRYISRTDTKSNYVTHPFPINFHHATMCGTDSVVGIATGYGLDGPGIESRWEVTFSAPVQTGPGAHPASCTMATGSFPGVKSSQGVTLTPHPLLVPLVMKE